METKKLIFHVEKPYFEEIRSGSKLFEYRLQNERWKKRIEGKTFSGIEIRLGYPKISDKSRILKFEYNGYIKEEIIVPHFGTRLCKVFAFPLLNRKTNWTKKNKKARIERAKA